MPLSRFMKYLKDFFQYRYQKSIHPNGSTTLRKIPTFTRIFSASSKIASQIVSQCCSWECYQKRPLRLLWTHGSAFNSLTKCSSQTMRYAISETTIYFQAKQKWWLHQGLLFTSINTCVFKTLILHRVRTNYTAKHSLEEQRMNSSVHTEADDQNSAVEQTTRTRSSAYTMPRKSALLPFKHA